MTILADRRHLKLLNLRNPIVNMKQLKQYRPQMYSRYGMKDGPKLMCRDLRLAVADILQTDIQYLIIAHTAGREWSNHERLYQPTSGY